MYAERCSWCNHSVYTQGYRRQADQTVSERDSDPDPEKEMR